MKKSNLVLGGGSPRPLDRAKQMRRPTAIAGGSPEPMARGYVKGRYQGSADKAQDLVRPEHELRDRPKGLTGTLMKSLSSHPRYYEQKTAAEAKLGRKLSPDEFERNHWVEPDSEIISGTSIFDPVLCELAYRWFSPPGGRILDPFAGGSVRGIVAAWLGRHYTGIDLSERQVIANHEQWKTIGKKAPKGGSAKWLVGDSQAMDDLLAGYESAADLVFSCPPYGDLEVYSEDKRDLSTKTHDEFILCYRTIIAKAVGLLRPDRFAVFVVGDFRDKKGFYRNFVSTTIAAFQMAGAKLYNEAVLVTSVGSLPIRVGRQFAVGRKLGKTHQNLLVFVKGDPIKATKACGEIEIPDLATMFEQPDLSRSI